MSREHSSERRSGASGATRGLAWSLAVLAIAAVLFIVIALNPRRSTAKFVVPDGFRGAIQVIANSPQGTAPRQNGIEEIYEVPPTGILAVSGAGPFSSAQSMRAVYASGAPLPTMDDLIPDPRGVTRLQFDPQNPPIALWMLEQDDHGFWMYVGVEAEAQSARFIHVAGQRVSQPAQQP